MIDATDVIIIFATSRGNCTEVTAQSQLRWTGTCAGRLSNECHVQTKMNKNRMREKERSNGNKSEKVDGCRALLAV